MQNAERRMKKKEGRWHFQFFILRSALILQLLSRRVVHRATNIFRQTRGAAAATPSPAASDRRGWPARSLSLRRATRGRSAGREAAGEASALRESVRSSRRREFLERKAPRRRG